MSNTTVIVELVDKKSGFADPSQGVNFSPSKVVQEVKRTPSLVKAMRQGILMKTTKKRLEEWNSERAKYVTEHLAAKKEANDAASKASVTLRERFKAVSDELATERAIVKTLKKEIEDLTKKLEALTKDHEALTKELQDSETTEKKSTKK